MLGSELKLGSSETVGPNDSEGSMLRLGSALITSGVLVGRKVGLLVGALVVGLGVGV